LNELVPLGSFTLTSEMINCMVDDRLQIHFEYGKRQQLAGAVACFDHADYIHQGTRATKAQTVEDEIPFTVLNICHKHTEDRRRCFLYAYQVMVHVEDDWTKQGPQYPLLEPRVYAKIAFKSLKKKMIILPGD